VAALKEADSHQVHLLRAIDRLIQSNSSGATVLHWTSVEHVLPNSMVARAASMYSGANVAFVVLTEHGVEQLGRVGPWVKGRAPLLPAGWREVTDSESGGVFYIGPRNETRSIRPLTEAAKAAGRLFDAYGIDSLPTTQIWKGGKLMQELGSVALDAALGKLVAEDNLYDKPPGVAGDCA